jgi:hypothetical protein
MENFAKKKLIDLLEETNNPKTKRVVNGLLEVMKTDGVSNTKIVGVITEALGSLRAGDKSVENYFNYMTNIDALNNVGMKELIFEAKNTALYKTDTEFQELIDDCSENLGTHAEYMLANTFVPGIKRFAWNKAIKSSIAVVEGKLEKFKAYKMVAETIDAIKADANADLYEDLLIKLDRAFALPENMVRHYVNTQIYEMGEHHPAISNLINNLILLEKSGVGAYSNLSKVTSVIDRHNGRVTAQERITPALFTENKDKDYFLMNNSIYEISKTGMKKVKNLHEAKLPSKFISLCETFMKFRPDGKKLKITDGIYEYALRLNEDSAPVGIEIDGIEQKEENSDVLSDLSTMGIDQGLISLISDMIDGAEDLALMDNIVTVMPIDGGVIIDIIKLNSGNCDVYVNICDVSAGIDELINTKDTPDIAAQISNDYGIDIDTFLTEEDGGEGGAIETEEEIAAKKELEDDLEKYKDQLDEVISNLEKITDLGEDYQGDEEISSLKDQLEERKTLLLDKIKESETTLNGGEEKPETLDMVVERIYDEMKDICYNGEYGTKLDESEDPNDSVVLTGGIHKISDNISVTPVMEFEKNDVGTPAGGLEGSGEQTYILSNAYLHVSDSTVSENADDEELALKFEDSKYNAQEGGYINLGLEPTSTDTLPETLKEDISNVINTITPEDFEGIGMDEDADKDAEAAKIAAEKAAQLKAKADDARNKENEEAKKKSEEEKAKKAKDAEREKIKKDLENKVKGVDDLAKSVGFGADANLARR